VERRAGVKLDANALTIGFARRAATYKRADLVFSDLDRLEAIAREGWPLQFVFAGKAHPNDVAGKAIIERIFEARNSLAGKIPVVYLEDHDMNLGRLLCSGVDLWLNNPQMPQEASGTSGMKAALNGVPSLSVLDGWWPEGWLEGVTGWSIGGSVDLDAAWTSEVDSLYYKLRYVIIPLFYGSSTGFARVMRSTIAVNGAYFTSQRMLEEYIENAYALHHLDRV
jgi:starch phosphorylase